MRLWWEREQSNYKVNEEQVKRKQQLQNYQRQVRFNEARYLQTQIFDMLTQVRYYLGPVGRIYTAPLVPFAEFKKMQQFIETTGVVSSNSSDNSAATATTVAASAGAGAAGAAGTAGAGASAKERSILPNVLYPEVLLLSDNTKSQSGKSGLILTFDGIYISDSSKGWHYYHYLGLRSITYDAQHLKINQQSFSMPYINNHYVFVLIDKLRSLNIVYNSSQLLPGCKYDEVYVEHLKELAAAEEKKAAAAAADAAAQAIRDAEYEYDNYDPESSLEEDLAAIDASNASNTSSGSADEDEEIEYVFDGDPLYDLLNDNIFSIADENIREQDDYIAEHYPNVDEIVPDPIAIYEDSVAEEGPHVFNIGTAQGTQELMQDLSISHIAFVQSMARRVYLLGHDLESFFTSPNDLLIAQNYIDSIKDKLTGIEALAAHNRNNEQEKDRDQDQDQEQDQDQDSKQTKRAKPELNIFKAFAQEQKEAEAKSKSKSKAKADAEQMPNLNMFNVMNDGFDGSLNSSKALIADADKHQAQASSTSAGAGTNTSSNTEAKAEDSDSKDSGGMRLGMRFVELIPNDLRLSGEYDADSVQTYSSILDPDGMFKLPKTINEDYFRQAAKLGLMEDSFKILISHYVSRIRDEHSRFDVSLCRVFARFEQPLWLRLFARLRANDEAEENLYNATRGLSTDTSYQREIRDKVIQELRKKYGPFVMTLPRFSHLERCGLGFGDTYAEESDFMRHNIAIYRHLKQQLSAEAMTKLKAYQQQAGLSATVDGERFAKIFAKSTSDLALVIFTQVIDAYEFVPCFCEKHQEHEQHIYELMRLPEMPLLLLATATASFDYYLKDIASKESKAFLHTMLQATFVLEFLLPYAHTLGIELSDNFTLNLNPQLKTAKKEEAKASTAATTTAKANTNTTTTISTMHHLMAHLAHYVEIYTEDCWRTNERLSLSANYVGPKLYQDSYISHIEKYDIAGRSFRGNTTMELLSLMSQNLSEVCRNHTTGYIPSKKQYCLDTFKDRLECGVEGWRPEGMSRHEYMTLMQMLLGAQLCSYAPQRFKSFLNRVPLTFVSATNAIPRSKRKSSTR